MEIQLFLINNKDLVTYWISVTDKKCFRNTLLLVRQKQIVMLLKHSSFLIEPQMHSFHFSLQISGFFKVEVLI